MRADKAARRAAPPLQLAVCTGPLERARGLLGRPPPPAGTALWITPCRAVHTWGMRYPIDVAFVDERGLVLKVVPACPPRSIALHARAVSALEMRAGECERLRVRAGERLVLPQPDGASRPSVDARETRGLRALTVVLIAVTAWMLVGCAGARRSGTAAAPTSEPVPAPAAALAELSLQAGLEYYSRAWPAAEAAYRELVRLQPEHGEHWYRLGVIFLHTQRPDAAARAFEASLLLGARPGLAQQSLAIARLAQAVDALRAAHEAASTPGPPPQLASSGTLEGTIATVEGILPAGVAPSSRPSASAPDASPR